MTRSSSRGELFKQRAVAPKCRCQHAQVALLSGAGGAAEGKKQASRDWEGGLCGVGAVPAEGRSLLFEPGKGGSWGGGEDISWAGQVHGAERRRPVAPCGVSTALSAVPLPRSTAVEDGGVTSAKWLRRYPAHGTSSLVSLGAYALMGSWPVHCRSLRVERSTAMDWGGKKAILQPQTWIPVQPLTTTIFSFP